MEDMNPLEDARRLLAADRERREKDCAAELAALLERHGCGLALAANGGPVPPGWIQISVTAVR